MKNVLVLVSCYIPGYKAGGPVRTISNMADALGDEFEFYIVCQDRDLGDAEPYRTVRPDVWTRVRKANVFYASGGVGGFISLCRAVFNFKGSIVHLNSFFSFRFSILPFLVCKFLRPSTKIIIGPRGEFSVGALHLKSFKKKLFISLSRSLGLYKKIIWHASSDFETADIRRIMGRHVKILVAIDISTPQSEVSFVARLPDEPLRLIFVSRISPMKNLLGAILALKDVESRVVFDVYGPTEDVGYWTQCLEAAKSLPSHVGFRYCGALRAEEVPAKLVKYDLFFLPTLGENFGHVIAEALSSGVPLLISDTTPWRNLVQTRLGWDLPLNDMRKFSECIDACAVMSPEDHFCWRQSIREWALNHVGGSEAVDQNRQLFLSVEKK